MEFQTWVESNASARNVILPDFGFKTWDDFDENKKNIIWKHLEGYLFKRYPTKSANGYYYDFPSGPIDVYERQFAIERVIEYTTDSYIANNYAPNYLLNREMYYACVDFSKIFFEQKQDIVLEVISLFAREIIKIGLFGEYYPEIKRENEYEKSNEANKFAVFDPFANHFNKTLAHFGFPYLLTRTGFIPRQDDEINTQIYEPILKILSNKKWEKVNDLLEESFTEFRKHSPTGFSTCITKTVSAVQAFLQILVEGRTGTGDISRLLKDALENGLIPNDQFSKKIFKDIESTFMSERQRSGDAHPRKEFANEKNAKLVLNLAMVFFQHCLI